MRTDWQLRWALCFAVIIGLTAGVPGAQARLIPEKNAAATAPSEQTEIQRRLDRVIRLVDKSNAPNLIGRRRWRDLVALHRPLIERTLNHQEFAEAVNALFGATGLSHFHYYTDQDWFFWHLRSAFGGGSESHADHIGLMTEQIDGNWFVRGILEGSAATDSALRVGDELLSVDGRPFEPIGSFSGKAGKPVTVRVRRKPGLVLNVEIIPVRESLHDAVQRAIRRSIRVIEHEGHRFAYLHGWSLLGGGGEYRQLLDLQDEVDGLLLDYRDGFGGVSTPAMRFFFGSSRPKDGRDPDECWTRPAVILVADGTRSAKEIVVDAVQRHDVAPLLGTPTPGHVISVGGFRRIGSDGLIMLPGDRFALEGHPTNPDILVERSLPYTAGHDEQLRQAKTVLLELIRENEVGLVGHGRETRPAATTASGRVARVTTN